jgi:hypothetical protein
MYMSLMSNRNVFLADVVVWTRACRACTARGLVEEARGVGATRVGTIEA